jgi:hypothetical protein
MNRPRYWVAMVVAAVLLVLIIAPSAANRADDQIPHWELVEAKSFVDAVIFQPRDVEIFATSEPTPTTTTSTTAPPPPPPPPTTTSTPPPSVVAAPSTGSCGGWQDLVAAYFPADQVAKGCQVIMCESGGNPTADNPSSSASGLWQFLDRTWGGHGGFVRAKDAPPSVQTEKAAMLWRSSGWRPWSCA